MPSVKKKSASGNVYWLAVHQELGLILFDSTDQAEINPDECQVFCVDKLSYERMPRDDLRTKTSAAVTDSDTLRALYRYKRFRAPKKPDPTLQQQSSPHNRVTHCWQCKNPINNEVDNECERCGWIICGNCGACNC